METRIIYKFTIISKHKFEGFNPFYIGQHVGLGDFDYYYGSGKIWNDLIKRLKDEHPKIWKKLIKREILYKGTCNQKTLDTLEKLYIKKEKSHYSYKLGGCNVLWGTANRFGSGSPMKDPECRAKQSESLKEYYKNNNHPCLGKKASEELRKKLSESHIGIRHSKEVVEKIRAKNKGRKRSEEFCILMKENWKKKKESNWINPMKGVKVDKEIIEKRAERVRRYYANNPGSFVGRKHTEETKDKMKKIKIGYRLGSKSSEETKSKIRESAKKSWDIRKSKLNDKI